MAERKKQGKEQSDAAKAETPSKPDLVHWSRSMARIAERSQKLVTDFMSHQEAFLHPSALYDPMKIGDAFIEMTHRLMADPQYLMRAQMSLWNSYIDLWQSTSLRLLGEESDDVAANPAGDRRFKDPLWQDGTLFNYLRQSYLLTARWMQSVVAEVDGLDDKTRQKLDFYTREFVNALSPSNFVATNPEVLRVTFETGGANLLTGLENLLEDLERGRGELLISMTDETAFSLGENIAVSEGAVIYQNRLMQLIQYAPQTEQVHKRPLLILPPWINKFYILDLREKNSLVRWLTQQGYTVFMVSWANPTEDHSDIEFEDYIELGLMAALDEIEKATGEDSINAIGYCLGGTMLAAGLSVLEQKGDTRINAASFFVTMTDFQQAGDVTVFIDEEQLDHLESKMAKKGYLDARAMQTSFNLLRSNDLIWSFVVNNYLLGREPLPFDLLYWNADSTNLPAKMHSYYLRNMYQKNLLVEPGKLTMLGHKIDLSKVKTPSCWIAAKDDHIAPWHSVYSSARQFAGPIKFILGASGHIAGIINPPAANKYCYWSSTKRPQDHDAWLEGAAQHDGSWWPEWESWLSRKSGAKVAARALPQKVLEPAPGSHVKKRSESLGDPAQAD